MFKVNWSNKNQHMFFSDWLVVPLFFLVFVSCEDLRFVLKERAVESRCGWTLCAESRAPP